MKSLLVSCALLLIGVQAKAEVPLQHIKGLDAKMRTAVSPVNNGENIFSPIYGVLALKTALPEIRLGAGGRYGLQKDNQQNLMHSAFFLHTDDTHRLIADEHAKTKQFEYPYDPISALIQWFFPSVDGASLVANERNKDPITEFAQSIKSDGVLFSKFIKLINASSENLISVNKFKQSMLLIFSLPAASFSEKQTIELNRLADIIYRALVQDGTFGTKKGRDTIVYRHDPLYPKNIALHTILAYMWRVADSIEQIDQIMVKSELTRDNFHASFYDSYNKEDYETIKSSLIKGERISFEKMVFAGFGYDLYEKTLPESIFYGQAKAPNTYGENKSYADCGETLLRYLIGVFLHQGGGEFNPEFIKTELLASPKMREIQGYFSQYPTFSLQQSQKARDAWSLIVSDLNNKQFPSEPMDVDYYDYCNIKAAKGIKNLLNIFAKLTQDQTLSELWSEDNDLLKEQLIKKLDRLCELFSRTGFEISWSAAGIENNPVLVHGIFKFSFQQQNGITSHVDLEIQPGHFKANPVMSFINDWRKEVSVTDNTNELLSFFFGEHRKPYLDSSRADNNIRNKFNDFFTLEDNQAKIDFYLRYLYVLFGRQLDDQYTQIQFMSFLNKIRSFDGKEMQISSFIRKTLLETNINKDLFEIELFGNLDSESSNHNISLEKACEFGLYRVARHILSQDTSILTTPRRDAPSYLSIAAKNGHLEISDLLIRSGSSVNHADDVSIFTEAVTPLMHACGKGNLELMKFLIENGADPHFRTNYGVTAFWMAAFYHQLPALKFLHEYHVDINPLDEYGLAKKTPICWNIEADHLEIADWLATSGANINKKHDEPQTTLMNMAMIGRVNSLDFCIRNGDTSINEKTRFQGMTALIFAARNGHLDAVKYLVEQGAEIDARTAQSRYVELSQATALLFSALKGHKEVFQYLVQKNADVLAEDQHGNNALALAIKREKDPSPYESFDRDHQKNLEMIDYIFADDILFHRLGFDSIDKLFLYACQRGDHKIIHKLLQKAQDVGATISNTAAMHASMNAVQDKNLNTLRFILSLNLFDVKGFKSKRQHPNSPVRKEQDWHLRDFALEVYEHTKKYDRHDTQAIKNIIAELDTIIGNNP